MSQKIEVLTPTGNSYRVKNSAAHQLVREGRAFWVGVEHNKLQEIPSILLPDAIPSGFRDVWKLKPSGGMPTWQYCAR